MKWKVELQTLFVLICALIIATLWLTLNIVRNDFGTFSETAELYFHTTDASGLQVRTPLYCQGAVVGHVRSFDLRHPEGEEPYFSVVAGIHKDYATCQFLPQATLKSPPIGGAIMPSSIELQLARTKDANNATPQPHKGLLSRLRNRNSQNQKDKNPKGNELKPDSAGALDRMEDKLDRIVGDAREFFAKATTAVNGVNTILEDINQAIPGEERPVAQVLQSLPGTLKTVQAAADTLDKRLVDMEAFTKRDSDVHVSIENFKELSKKNGEVEKTLKKLRTTMDDTNENVSLLNERFAVTLELFNNKVARFGETAPMRFFFSKKPPEPRDKTSVTDKVAATKTKQTRAPAAVAQGSVRNSR